MPLYRCEKCGCVENTALGWYHCRNMKSTPEQWRKALCSEHGPKFIDGDFTAEEDGNWHGQFTKKPATGWYVDKSGFIWEPNYIKGAPHAYGAIIGKYAEDGSIIPLTEEEEKEHTRLNLRETIDKCLADLAKAPSSKKAGRPWVTLSNKKSKQKKR